MPLLCIVKSREFRRGKVSEMSGPLPYTGGECSLAVDYGIAATHQVGNIMKSAVLIIEVVLMKGDRTCPVISMGRSKSFITVELVLSSFMSSQPDTSTEGSVVVSLTREPGRKATVLAHI